MEEAGEDVWQHAGAVEEPPRSESARDDVDVLAQIALLDQAAGELLTLPTARERLVPVLAWLLSQQSSDASISSSSATLHVLQSAYSKWTCRYSGEGDSASNATAVDGALWLQLVEIGVRLAMLANKDTSSHALAQLLQWTTRVVPANLPNAQHFCERERNAQFAIGLYDATVAIAISDGDNEDDRRVAAVVDVFVGWMARAMQAFEVVFLHQVGASLVKHMQARSSVPSVVLGRVLSAYVHAHTGSGRDKWRHHAPQLAITVLITRVMVPQVANSAVAPLFRLVLDDLAGSDAFPDVHNASAVVAMALSVSGATLHGTLPPFQVALVDLFAGLRAVNLVLLSPRLLLRGDQDLDVSHGALQASLRRAVAPDDSASGAFERSSVTMIQAFVVEVATAVSTSASIQRSVLDAMSASNPDNPVFLPSLAEYHTQLKSSDADTLEFPARAYLENVYDVVAAAVQIITEQSGDRVEDAPLVLRCFSIMTQVEFARECCGTPERNVAMVQLTQRVDGLLERAPDSTLSALCDLALRRPTHLTLPHDADFLHGWTILAIGLLIQRKLRVVLLQTSERVRRDAIAVVFAGLYHGLEPLDAFAHRFLAFSLSSLTQFLPVYELFPHYLQVTLTKYPTIATRERTANVLGTIFGSLYYTRPTSDAQDSDAQITAAGTRHDMILWGIRQCRARSTELLQLAITDDTKDEAAATKATTRASGLHLAELFLEIAKLGPVESLPLVAQEMEALVKDCASNPPVQRAIKERVFDAIALNCEAEKRAWLAAWYLELTGLHPTPHEDAPPPGASAEGGVSTPLSRL